MPRVLPDATSIKREVAGNDVGQIRVGQIDYSPMAQGAQAIGRGLHEVGSGLKSFQAAQDEIDDYETKKKLVDFKLKSEMALEEAKRGMAPGGAGFSEQWSQSFREQTRELVGEGDKNIPASQRAKLGLALKQHEAQLMERAQRYQLAEEDLYHKEDVNKQLVTLRDTVEKDPTRRQEMADEGRKLIDLSRLPSADKYRIAKAYETELDKAQAISEGMAIQSEAEREAFRKRLRVDGPDGGRREVFRFGSTQHTALVKASEASGVPLGVLQAFTGIESGGNPRNVTGSYKGMLQLSEEEFRKYGGTGSILDPEENALAGARKLKAEMDQFQAKYGRQPDPAELYMIHQQGWGGYEAHTNNPNQAAWKSMASTGEGRKKGEAWAKQAIWGNLPADMKAKFGSVENVTSKDFTAFWQERYAREAAKGSGGEGDAPPDAEFRNLTLEQRRAIFKQADGEWTRKQKEVHSSIESLRDRAIKGTLPTDQEMAAIFNKVDATNNPVLRAEFDNMVWYANTVNGMKKLPPLQAEAYVRNLRTSVMAAQGGGLTAEQQKQIEGLEKAAAEMRKQVNADAMSYAHKVGMEVPLPAGAPADPNDFPAAPQGQSDPMDFPAQPAPRPTYKIELQKLDMHLPGAEDRLRQRFIDARAVADGYSQGIQVFTQNERDYLKDMIARGASDPKSRAELKWTLRTIVAAAGEGRSADGMAALREFTKDSPEAYMVGTLLLNGGSERLIDETLMEMSERSKGGDKYINRVDRKSAAPDLAVPMSAVRLTPGMADPINHMAELIYNRRHRSMGLDKYDPNLHKEIVQEVLGQTKDDKGTTYGGVGRQGTGIDGKWQQPVIVPNGVRQDSFDKLVGSLRPEDMPRIGRAFDGNGKPLTMPELQSAVWVSMGNDRYALQLGGTPEAPQYAAGENGEPAVVDLKPIMGTMRQRKPEIFATTGGAAASGAGSLIQQRGVKTQVIPAKPEPGPPAEPDRPLPEYANDPRALQ